MMTVVEYEYTLLIAMSPTVSPVLRDLENSSVVSPPIWLPDTSCQSCESSTVGTRLTLGSVLQSCRELYKELEQ